MNTIILIVAGLTLALAADKPIEIVKQNSEVNLDGSFKSSYETGNGIVVEEQGVLKNAGNKDTEAEEVQGSFKYTAPDGTPIQITYLANENGFQPQGEHLPVAPTGPPVPPLIARALEWIAAHPQPEEAKKGSA
ncbi:Insect cuticle protein [Popillia japonica]|uniref:Insect cuticle protein n=1 Tax=Popillia japonica TaxID=7064 RepID=A0AAW1K1P8_POPJA